MNDAAFVRGIEGVDQLPGDVQRFANRQWAVVDPIVKRRTFDELKDEALDGTLELWAALDAADQEEFEAMDDGELDPEVAGDLAELNGREAESWHDESVSAVVG